MKSGIYKILNTVTNKFYIGSAVNIKIRLYEHQRQLKNNKHPNRYLQFAWNKNWANFKFEVIEYCEPTNLIEREQYWINFTECCNDKIGYNLVPTAGSQLGFKHSNETKRIISSKASNISEETRRKMQEHIFSEEHRKNLSIKRNKRITSKETKLKLSLAGKGRKHTKENVEKMSAIKKEQWKKLKEAKNKYFGVM